MITENLSSTTSIQFYEALRTNVVGENDREKNNLGLSLFLNKGMVSWMKTCEQYIPATGLNDFWQDGVESYKGVDDPSDKESIVSIIASMVRQNLGDVLCPQI
jgi:hypothetical protein